VPIVGEFARITQKIIAEDGFDEYLPTTLYPARISRLVHLGRVEPVVVVVFAFQLIGS
jgi:hypothetical protein